MIRKLFVVLAWVSLGYIAYVTLSPIGLRPVATHNPAYERFAAYTILGVLFGLAYPRRIWMVLGVVVGAAIGLEGLQYLTPDRHGQLADLIEKASGGLFGALIANAASSYLPSD
jgi:glycopeptide antibiotics resistance protein